MRGSCKKRKVALIKIGILVLPEMIGQAQADMKKVIDRWIDSRLTRYRYVHCSSEGRDHVQIRVTFIDCKTSEGFRYCDAALMIVPPNVNCTAFPDVSIPGYILNFSGVKCVTELMEKANKELNYGFEKLFLALIDHQQVDNRYTVFKLMERISLKRLSCSMLKRALSTFDGNLQREFVSPHVNTSYSDEIATQLVSTCHNVLLSFLNRVDDFRGNLNHIPSDEFFDPIKNEIPNFFGDGQGLPRNWREVFRRDELEQKVWHLFPCFKSVIPFAEVLDHLLKNAPLHVRRENVMLLQQGKVVRCLEKALDWVDDIDETDASIVFPSGDVGTFLDDIVESSCDNQSRTIIRLEMPTLVHAKPLSMTEIKVLPEQAQTLMQTSSAKRTSDFVSFTKLSSKRMKTESMVAVHSSVSRRDDREGQKVIDRLKALRDGKSMFDIDIGNTSLSNILNVQRNNCAFPKD